MRQPLRYLAILNLRIKLRLSPISGSVAIAVYDVMFGS